jgi:hypothetical protein
MARISTYPIDSSVNVNDFVIGTDSEDSNITKNYTIASIISLAPGTVYINAADVTGTFQTVFANITDFVSLNSVLASQLASGWSVGSSPNQNRVVYTNATTRVCNLTFTVNITGTNGDDIVFSLFKNGAKIAGTEQTVEIPALTAALTMQALVSMATNDYIEVKVKNITATNNVTTTHLNVVAQSL